MEEPDGELVPNIKGGMLELVTSDVFKTNGTYGVQVEPVDY